MQTLADAKTYVAEFLDEASGDPSDPTIDSVLTTRLLPRWLSQGMERIFRKTYWRWTEDKIDLTWPTAGTEGSILYLPHFVYRIMSTVPGSNSSALPLRIIPAWRLDHRRPVGAWSSRPTLAIHGIYGVERDNPSTGVLTVTSTGGSGNQSVRLHGRDSNNYEIAETVTLANDTSSNTTGSFKSGVGGVQRIDLIGTANGSVITVTNGATQLERLDTNLETSHDHLRTELLQVSGSGSTTYTVRFWKRPVVPTLDTEPLPIPFEYHDLIETWIESKLLWWNGEREASALKMQEFKVDLAEMVAFDKRDPAKMQRFGIARSLRRRWY